MAMNSFDFDFEESGLQHVSLIADAIAQARVSR
jgi:hypothetical protein